MDQYFDFIVTSEEAGADKPSKEPFQLAIDKINPTGSNYWMIGDNFDADIRGAKLTINAVTIEKIHQGIVEKADESKLDASFKDYAHLRDLISNIK